MWGLLKGTVGGGGVIDLSYIVYSIKRRPRNTFILTICKFSKSECEIFKQQQSNLLMPNYLFSLITFELRSE